MYAFKFLEVDHQLEIVDKNSTTFRSEHKFLLEAMQPSRFFVREYFWTGSGAEKEHIPEVVSDIDCWGFPNHRIHGPLLTEGNARILVVDLGRTICVGETLTVHFRHKMKDLGGTFKPFFRVKPSSQIGKLISLRVILPEWRGLKVMYRRFTHDTEKVLESREIKPLTSENGKHTFELKAHNQSKQNMGHKLEWHHEES